MVNLGPCQTVFVTGIDFDVIRDRINHSAEYECGITIRVLLRVSLKAGIRYTF
jgi:hypothetical protein